MSTWPWLLLDRAGHLRLCCDKRLLSLEGSWQFPGPVNGVDDARLSLELGTFKGFETGRLLVEELVSKQLDSQRFRRKTIVAREEDVH